MRPPRARRPPCFPRTRRTRPLSGTPPARITGRRAATGPGPEDPDARTTAPNRDARTTGTDTTVPDSTTTGKTTGITTIGTITGTTATTTTGTTIGITGTTDTAARLRVTTTANTIRIRAMTTASTIRTRVTMTANTGPRGAGSARPALFQVSASSFKDDFGRSFRARPKRPQGHRAFPRTGSRPFPVRPFFPARLGPVFKRPAARPVSRRLFAPPRPCSSAPCPLHA